MTNPTTGFAATDPCPEGCTAGHAAGVAEHELRFSDPESLRALGKWIGREADRRAAQ